MSGTYITPKEATKILGVHYMTYDTQKLGSEGKN